MALLEVNDIHVSYGSIVALRGVTLAIQAGERVALLGANGAGKSTTLRAISGMNGITSGSIHMDGQPIHNLPPYEVVKHGITHGPEGRELFGALSVEENLRLGFWPQLKRGAGKGDYHAMLERVYDLFPRLRERRKQEAITMSGGEQQMLVMARALMSNPKVLMMDEMSLGLAPMIVQQLFDIAAEVNQQGTAVVIVEQFVHTALNNTDRAYVLEKGTVVLEGKSKDLLADPELLAAYLGEADHGGGDAKAEEPKAKPAAKRPRAAKK
jgi:branched-chain amino acid transport system ATP-binding protein